MLFLLSCLAASCGYGEITGSQVCFDVGVAIANKTLECTGDVALADVRFEAFEAFTTCRLGDGPIDDPGPYACHSAIRALKCSEAERYGENLAGWLSQFGCSLVLSFSGSWDPYGDEA
jgi:hypothetical protein